MGRSSFGKATETAVKAFQQKNDLVVDGICGEKTFAALANTKNKRSVIRIMDETGIRWGNGEGYAEKRKAAPGEQLEWIVQAPNHWLAVVDEGYVCWVDSEKAIKL